MVDAIDEHNAILLCYIFYLPMIYNACDTYMVCRKWNRLYVLYIYANYKDQFVY